MSFREAVMELASGGSGVEKKIVLPPAVEKPFNFEDIEIAPSMERVISNWLPPVELEQTTSWLRPTHALFEVQQR